MSKRKPADCGTVNGKFKKRALSDDEVRSNFRNDLFDTKVLDAYQKQYAESQPFKHAVIQDLVDKQLLRKVRDEIQQHVSFTPKETDIYKIHQSGDLANLDGLDDLSLSKLPSLLRLRDALYSSVFRTFIAAIAGSGPLSGVKTDLAINVYTPGCHLLCHDDVIGSRRVSYILYLLDPHRPWQPHWGGSLRLFPTEDLQTATGDMVKVPLPDHTVCIPPLFNQLAFFTVQPGASFHDVQEVYERAQDDDVEDGGRVRMAVSGWFHIPQDGEEGYQEGGEELLAEQSSLKQLEGGAKAARFDQPQRQWLEYATEEGDGENECRAYGKGKGKAQRADGGDEGAPLSEQEFELLLRFMTPTYLAPDTVEDLSASFADNSVLRLDHFLAEPFSARLRAFLETHDHETPATMPVRPSCVHNTGVARPPHKHRFLFRHSTHDVNGGDGEGLSPYDQLLDIFFPSIAFKKWLALATGLTPTRASIQARRFRRGMDYTLATSYDEEHPQLEVTLGITPSRGCDGEADAANGTEKKPNASDDDDDGTPGGYEMYMAADDGVDGEEANNDVAAIDGPAGSKGSAMTGAGNRLKADPAVYRASTGGGGDDDDGVLFSMAASWNCMSIVLRDKGVLRFVKYVSQAAKGDRWDVCGDFDVEFDDDEDADGGV